MFTIKMIPLLLFFYLILAVRDPVHIYQLIELNKNELKNYNPSFSCYDSSRVILTLICDLPLSKIRASLKDLGGDFEFDVREEFKN